MFRCSRGAHLFHVTQEDLRLKKLSNPISTCFYSGLGWPKRWGAGGVFPRGLLEVTRVTWWTSSERCYTLTIAGGPRQLRSSQNARKRNSLRRISSVLGQWTCDHLSVTFAFYCFHLYLLKNIFFRYFSEFACWWSCAGLCSFSLFCLPDLKPYQVLLTW